MPAARNISRTETLELKSQIELRIGRLKAEKYFDLLAKFLGLKISKSDFDRLCIGTIGRENVHLHNLLLQSILKSACPSKTAPTKDNNVEGAFSLKLPNGYQRSSLQSLCRDIPRSPRKGRTPNLCDRKFKDRPSPLGPHAKNHNIAFEDSITRNQEQRSATELLSFGRRPPGSVEDGEEVDQGKESPSIHSKSPVRAPLGISINPKGTHKMLSSHLESSCRTETCHLRGELPDTDSLRKRLKQNLEIEGINVSSDCANLLNSSLDVYLKRLIKPCLDLAHSRSKQKQVVYGHSRHGLNGMWPATYAQKASGFTLASMLDFRIAMDLNPSVLGPDWPIQLEKVHLHASEE